MHEHPTDWLSPDTPATPPPTTRPAAQKVDWTSGYLPLILGGIGAMASGLLMPWVTLATPLVGQVSHRGVESFDGKLFAVGVLLLAVMAWREAHTSSPRTLSLLLVGVVVMAAGLLIEYGDLTRLVGEIHTDFGQAKLGFGPYAMGVGLTTTLAGILKRRLLLHPRRAQAPVVRVD